MKTLITILIIVIIVVAFTGNVMSNVEQPKYKVLQSKGAIELRDYEPMIVAEVEVSGERKEAIKQGFKILADFIFGDNVSKEKIAMTAPVTQEEEKNRWKIRFVMPSEYSLETLPQPNSSMVTLTQLPAYCVAAIRFSGLADDASIKEEANKLRTYIVAENLKSSETPILAFYNPPWTLPFLRRNEVMVEVECPVELSEGQDNE